jgi:ZIP family zinc transporter
MTWQIYGLIFTAGLVSALTTGVGTIPLFWARDVSDEWNVGLWGLAAGLMTSASIFGLGYKMYIHPGDTWIGIAGLVSGALLIVLTHTIIDWLDFDAGATDIAKSDLKTILSVLLVLTVHSFPEGIAVGVSFAELESSTTISVIGFSIPLLAVVMTVTIGIHNIPEGVAIGVPLADEGSVSNAQMFGAAALSSLPQPIGAVIAYYFLQLAQRFLEFGYGFAAGAMLYLVVQDIIPEGLEAGEQLENAKTYLATGAIVGFVGFLPLVFFL